MEECPLRQNDHTGSCQSKVEISLKHHWKCDKVKILLSVNSVQVLYGVEG